MIYNDAVRSRFGLSYLELSSLVSCDVASTYIKYWGRMIRLGTREYEELGTPTVPIAESAGQKKTAK